MAPVVEKMPLYDNPNAIPLKTKFQPVQPYSPPQIYRDEPRRWQPSYDRSRSPRARTPIRARSPPPRVSPARPRSLPQAVQPFQVHDDRELIEELNADNQNLLDQIEKLTLKLDAANVHVSAQDQRITDLKEKMKEKQVLIEQYQKMVRTERANKVISVETIEKLVEQCERFKVEIIKLSHRIYHMHTAVITADIPDQLKEQFVKLKKEDDSVKNDLVKDKQLPRARKKQKT